MTDVVSGRRMDDIARLQTGDRRTTQQNRAVT